MCASLSTLRLSALASLYRCRADIYSRTRWLRQCIRDVRTLTKRLRTSEERLGGVSIPPEALERISELMSPGASLVISDQGLGPETGKGTDFIVLTR